jgi:hypothetical protein
VGFLYPSFRPVSEQWEVDSSADLSNTRRLFYWFVCDLNTYNYVSLYDYELLNRFYATVAISRSLSILISRSRMFGLLWCCGRRYGLQRQLAGTLNYKLIFLDSPQKRFHNSLDTWSLPLIIPVSMLTLHASCPAAAGQSNSLEFPLRCSNNANTEAPS